MNSHFTDALGFNNRAVRRPSMPHITSSQAHICGGVTMAAWLLRLCAHPTGDTDRPTGTCHEAFQ